MMNVVKRVSHLILCFGIVSCTIDEIPVPDSPNKSDLGGVGNRPIITWQLDGGPERSFSDLSATDYPVYSRGYLNFSAYNFNSNGTEFIELGLSGGNITGPGLYNSNDFSSASVKFEDAENGYDVWYDSEGDIYALQVNFEEFNNDQIIGTCIIQGPHPNPTNGTATLEIEFKLYAPTGMDLIE